MIQNSLASNFVLDTLYKEAKPYQTRYKSEAFWLNWLIHKFPQVENFAPVAQWGPDGGKRRYPSTKRCDMAILDFRVKGATNALLFFEQRRDGQNLGDLEDIVLGSANKYLETHDNSYVYCMTGWTTRARCWVVPRTTPEHRRQLAPMFGSTARADRNSYYDANSLEANYITRSIAHMKGEFNEWPDSRTPNVLDLSQEERRQPTARNLFI